ncbi:uncharacterized protein nmnat3 isoform X3 [Mugil cephalus]|nr:uncharacterized protein nmnat3 isoform X3 [Mugil cephalus]
MAKLALQSSNWVTVDGWESQQPDWTETVVTMRSVSPAEAPVRSRLPGHLQDPGHVAGRARGGAGRAFRPRLRQPGDAPARAGRARVGHAVPPRGQHLPREGVGAERDERHRGPEGAQTRPEREVPGPGPRDRLHSPARPLHGGQREEERGLGAEAARQTSAAAGEEFRRLRELQGTEALFTSCCGEAVLYIRPAKKHIWSKTCLPAVTYFQ